MEKGHVTIYTEIDANKLQQVITFSRIPRENHIDSEYRYSSFSSLNNGKGRMLFSIVTWFYHWDPIIKTENAKHFMIRIKIEFRDESYRMRRVFFKTRTICSRLPLWIWHTFGKNKGVDPVWKFIHQSDQYSTPLSPLSIPCADT